MRDAVLSESKIIAERRRQYQALVECNVYLVFTEREVEVVEEEGQYRGPGRWG